MTYPIFSNGQVLPASDLNAIGLWLVKSQTVGTGVSSVTVTGAFSADYDNYRIIYTDGSASSTSNVGLTLGSTATGYYGFLSYGTAGGGTLYGANTNNGASWNYSGDTTSSGITVDVDLFNPYKTMRTQLSSRYMGTGTGAAFGTYQGLLNNSTSYTAFTLTPGNGTITGGTIRVYGYRN